MRTWAQATSITNLTAIQACAKTVANVLESYGALGSASNTRAFRWLSDPDLRTIVQRDYAELTTILAPAGAWKSAVALAGSILEALLVDIVIKDATRLAIKTNL